MGYDRFVKDGSGLVRLRDDVFDSRGVVPGLRAAEALQLAACRTAGEPRAVAAIAEMVHQDGDQLAAIAGVHALSGVSGVLADAALVESLSDPRSYINAHAAWALSARPPLARAMHALARMVVEGGFRGMLAQRTLVGWAGADPGGVIASLLTTLEAATGSARASLIDTIGEVPGPVATFALERCALDDRFDDARLAAVAALGWRSSDPALLQRLAMSDDQTGEAALLALVDRTLVDRGVTVPAARTTGRHVAQVVIHADLDGADRAGVGDNGGVATLVSQLSTAFAEHPGVSQVTTITRGSMGGAIADASFGFDQRQRLAVVPFGGDRAVDRRGGWVHRLAVERGVRRVLLAGDRPDVVHLRMADVGTLAASRVARQLDIPVVFTAAPDPHVVLDQLDGTTITRQNFGTHDELEHFWFRARMVERMVSQATQVVLLPRRDATHELVRMFGDRVAQPLDRAVIVSEGVDPRPIDRARRAIAALHESGVVPRPLVPLRIALEQLAPDRHGLPLVVSVGRLHPSKGMDRLADAWTGDPHLRATSNLVIVGGDLESPNADELDVLGDLDEITGDAETRRRTGVVLLGHQTNESVAHILAVAAIGLPGLVAPNGIYICAAAKEEFGLAIVEALGAGLTVVAPTVGGPATYVVDGETGVLTDTRSVARLRSAISEARGLVRRPGRVRQAQDHVREHLSIDAMAAALLDVYDSVRVGVS